MIDYDRKNWWRTCIAFYGTVLPYVLDRVGMLTGWCLVLCIVDEFVLEQAGYPLPALDGLGHSVLGVALGMFISFRTNSSYSRFWEARSHWGMLVNSSRNLVRMASIYAAPATELAHRVAAYIYAVKENLRGSRDFAALRPFISGRLLEPALAANNPPTLLAGGMSEWIAHRLHENRLDSIQAMRLEHLVGLMVDSQGGCEKIQRTPLPFVYASLLKQVLLVYLMTLPFVLVPRMDFAAPLVLAVVSFGLLGIEAAGVLIEDPFGSDSNHLPMEAICETILRDTADLSAAHTFFDDSAA